MMDRLTIRGDKSACQTSSRDSIIRGSSDIPTTSPQTHLLTPGGSECMHLTTMSIICPRITSFWPQNAVLHLNASKKGKSTQHSKVFRNFIIENLLTCKNKWIRHPLTWIMWMASYGCSWRLYFESLERAQKTLCRLEKQSQMAWIKWHSLHHSHPTVYNNREGA